MAKLKSVEMDVVGVVNRMIEVSGSNNYAQLASLLGLSPSAINQIEKRQSISLHLLLLIVKNFNCSLDYLVYGHGPISAGHTSALADESYIEIEPLHGEEGKAILFIKKLLPESEMIEDSLKFHAVGKKLWIINIADQNVVDGTFAFGDSIRPVICECRVQWDGKVIIEGDDKPKTIDEIKTVGVVGKVVWHGYAK